MPTNVPDHSGVAIPPPLLYAVPLAAGLLLHRAHPIVLMPRGIAVPLGVLLVALGLGLAGFAMSSFLRAHTSPLPVKPTTAIVATGPYRFTRNPMYVGLAGALPGDHALGGFALAGPVPAGRPLRDPAVRDRSRGALSGEQVPETSTATTRRGYGGGSEAHSRVIASQPCFFRSTFQTPSYPSISRLPGVPVIPSF